MSGWGRSAGKDLRCALGLRSAVLDRFAGRPTLRLRHADTPGDQMSLTRPRSVLSNDHQKPVCPTVGTTGFFTPGAR